MVKVVVGLAAATEVAVVVVVVVLFVFTVHMEELMVEEQGEPAVAAQDRAHCMVTEELVQFVLFGQEITEDSHQLV
jgi:hypothetical protein